MRKVSLVATKLENIFNLEEFEAHRQERFVKVQKHPELDLFIVNYTPIAQFERKWTDVTLNSRGLIFDAAERVVARPFAKFFNLQEIEGNLPKGPVEASEKMDGSLGILYRKPDGTYSIATRGSFASEQAVYGTELYNTRYAAKFNPEPELTYCFEIIYPGNRIVVNYKDLDDLVLLGAIENATGRSVSAQDIDWDGPKTQTRQYSTVDEVLEEFSKRENTGTESEGLVLYFPKEDMRVKLKHPEYVRLHRVMTDVSERRIWECLAEGEDLNAYLEDVPDEFYRQVSGTRDKLQSQYDALRNEVKERTNHILSEIGREPPRKLLAEKVMEQKKEFPLFHLIFAEVDGFEENIRDKIWKHLRPEEHIPFFKEDLP
jgi:RNA ligase